MFITFALGKDCERNIWLKILVRQKNTLAYSASTLTTTVGVLWYWSLENASDSLLVSSSPPPAADCRRRYKTFFIVTDAARPGKSY
jgi:hypothetical protein